MNMEGRIQATIDPELAEQFRIAVIKKMGSAKSTSKLLEKYIREGLIRDGLI